ncbi:hypothetical protein ADUPG1_004765, partial [Aduncisulcus paluster]
MVSGLFTACDNSSDNSDLEVEPMNHIEVGDIQYEDIHMMFAYSGERGDTEEESYPLNLYLYAGNIVYSNKEGLIESGFAHIRADIQVNV